MTTDKKTWFITGAGRGMGVDFAKAALAAGHNVVATGRNPDAVAEALGDSDDLLVVKLDVTSGHDAEAAAKAAVDRFGGIDVLVNNAAGFYAGHFEEVTPEGFEYSSAYAASEFGVDGWMESLAPEIAPFGIHTTVVNPGFFRTELLTKESTSYADSIEDYAERSAAQREFWESMNGRQGGDPAKLARALLTITESEQPPFRLIAGADAIALAEQKLAERQQQIDAFRELSSSLALDEAGTAAAAS